MKREAKTQGATLEINFSISPMNRVEFLQTVDSLMSSAHEATGIAARGCFEQVDKENTFLWRESWRSRGEAEERVQSGTIKTLLGAIGVLGELEGIEILSTHQQSEYGLGEA